MRKRIVLGLVAALAGLATLTALPAAAKVPGPNGRVVFARFDPALGGTVTDTVNPDGRHVEQLFSGGGMPHWSPDGGEVAIFCCDDGMAAHIVNADTGSFRELAPPDPDLEIHCGFGWSPDGQRLACETFGVTDATLNGVYSIRSSDGGGLAQITSNPGGDDIPGDYSPDGKRLVFVRSDENGPKGIFVTRLNGGGLRQITPPGMIVHRDFGGSWSPNGNAILFAARSAPDDRLAIWVVNADGGGLHQLPISPACGGAFSDPKSVSCFYPAWSPDGRKIVFARISANGTQENIYTVNVDGSSFFQVTKSGGASQPDWGPHPLIH
jgi:Tol biopolymer transport system component